MYKLKVTGSKKAKILRWEFGPEIEGVETYVKKTLEAIRTKHKMKIASCTLLTGGGEFVKSYTHIAKSL